MMTTIAKIISGGQTGVDRAALDVAIQLGIPHGGWCPRGRRSEDGCIPLCYDLTETTTDDYRERTRLNIQDAHGTLILTVGRATGGTLLTLRECMRSKKAYAIVDLAGEDARTGGVQMAREWLTVLMRDCTLNVAGPRESKHPGVYEMARTFLLEVLG